MQSDLLDLMKHQYQQKVLQLTNEMASLEKAKAESMSKSGHGLSQQKRKQIEDQFLSKQRELESQLRDAKDKNKKQQKVQLQVAAQSNKIKGLERDIVKIKDQKISAQRKYKE